MEYFLLFVKIYIRISNNLIIFIVKKNYKQVPNSSIIWSPKIDNKFIKVNLKQIELFEVLPKQLDENLSLSNNIKKISTYNENEIIKTVSWNVCKTNENSDFEDVIAIGLINGIIKFIKPNSISGELEDFFQLEKEFKPKYLKPILFIFWNPWIDNMLAQIIDKSKGSSTNEPSILIWEIQKLVDNKTFTQTSVSNYMAQKIVFPSGYYFQQNSIQNKPISGDFSGEQASFEFCRGDIVNSFAWINQSQFICSVNNKSLKIYELREQAPLKVVNTDATYNLCIDMYQPNIISSIIDEKIIVWKEDCFDKPVLTYIQEAIVENIEWSPLKLGYLCVTFKDKPFVKVLDTNIALINLAHEVEHELIDRYIKSSYEINILCATWHKTIENCILLLLVDERFELVYLQCRRVFAWSVEQKFVWTVNNNFKFVSYEKDHISTSSLSGKNTKQFSKHKAEKMDNMSVDSRDSNIDSVKNDTLNFLKKDISIIMQDRAQDGYGLKNQGKDFSYSSMFEKNSELRTFWSWIENTANNWQCNFEGYYDGKVKSNPFKGAIDGLQDIATVGINRNTSEMVFKISSTVSRADEVRWDHLNEALPFPKYTHPFRTKIFAACGWPFDQSIDKWRYILESLENKERAAAMALVTLNFDVSLQYIKRITSGRGIDSEILRLSLAGFNTRNYSHDWSAICKDVLKRLGNSRPYLRLLFNFLIAKNTNDLQFIKSLDIFLTDKIAIAALYMDDESLIDFFNSISNIYSNNGNLEMVTLTGLNSREFIDLLQSYLNRTNDIQTAAIAVLHANILTRNSVEKSTKIMSWVECYRNLLDNFRMWLIRADFDIATHYNAFNSSVKDIMKTVKPQSVGDQKSNLVGLSPISKQNQIYVACGFCGWKISQPSKYAANLNRNLIQNKTRPDGTLYNSNILIPNVAMQAGGCKPTICQHCRKPLPRCSVCLMNMGINSDTSNSSPNFQVNVGVYSQKDNQLPSNCIENWFMWCQKCKHGGHTSHLQQWFLEWSECPVSGCKCSCYLLDSSYSLFNVYGEKTDQKNNL